MRKSGLIAALVAVALPLAMATGALAQVKSPAGGGAARGGPAPAIGGGGGGPKGGMIGVGPRVGAGPQAGWSGPRQSWSGGQRWHGRRWIGPGIGFSTGLLLGGAYAASPYYYDDPYYYDSYPYDDGYILGGTTASPADIAYCRQRYRSYDVNSGTFLGNDGRRHPCP